MQVSAAIIQFTILGVKLKPATYVIRGLGKVAFGQSTHRSACVILCFLHFLDKLVVIRHRLVMPPLVAVHHSQHQQRVGVVGAQALKCGQVRFGPHRISMHKAEVSPVEIRVIVK